MFYTVQWTQKALKWYGNMKIITDVNQVKALAERRSEDNYEFRTFLKGTSLSAEEVDEIFREAYEHVRQHIDCNKCANCCKAALPTFSEEEMERIAEALNMSAEEFLDQYCCEDDSQKGYTFRERPCPMLGEYRCTLGEAAPDCCKEYPHLDKPGRRSRMYSLIDKSFTCPIVYNVLEQVKPIIRSREFRRIVGETPWEEFLE